jgi:hypothetical protein
VNGPEKLRSAFQAHLTARGLSLHAWRRDRGWSASLETSVSRWLRGRRDPRTGQRFGLPLAVRVAIADAIDFRGHVHTRRELARLERLIGRSSTLRGPSSSGSSSQEGEEGAVGTTGILSSKRKKKRRRARRTRQNAAKPA